MRHLTQGRNSSLSTKIELADDPHHQPKPGLLGAAGKSIRRYDRQLPGEVKDASVDDERGCNRERIHSSPVCLSVETEGAPPPLSEVEKPGRTDPGWNHVSARVTRRRTHPQPKSPATLVEADPKPGGVGKTRLAQVDALLGLAHEPPRDLDLRVESILKIVQ